MKSEFSALSTSLPTAPQPRRHWLKAVSILGVTAAFSSPVPSFAAAAEPATAVPTPTTPPDLGSRRELFVDDFLIERLAGAELKMHRPVAQDVALVCDAPWEGNTSAYFTLFADDDRFRMYYRGAHWDVAAKKEAHPEFTCYAESRDGLQWEKPQLGLFEFNGSKENNIILTGTGTHCFAAFKDGNPAAPPEARYKAVSAVFRKGLFAYQSPDGVRWSWVKPEPVITDGAFDSQNLAFWDAPAASIAPTGVTSPNAAACARSAPRPRRTSSAGKTRPISSMATRLRSISTPTRSGRIFARRICSSASRRASSRSISRSSRS